MRQFSSSFVEFFTLKNGHVRNLKKTRDLPTYGWTNGQTRPLIEMPIRIYEKRKQKKKKKLHKQRSYRKRAITKAALQGHKN